MVMEKTRDVGSNPRTVYWTDNFSRIFVVKVVTFV